jgi:anti-sigma factor RsiW
MKHPLSVDISSREADIEQQAHMTAYLLGELSQEQQIALERDYFAGDDVYDQLLAVEDELAYDYLQGRLSPERRARFENTIGRTERGRKNLEFAQALLDTLKATHPQRHHARYWAMGIASRWFGPHPRRGPRQSRRLFF